MTGDLSAATLAAPAALARSATAAASIAAVAPALDATGAETLGVTAGSRRVVANFQ